MKVVIIGANGQLGTDLCKVFQDSQVIPLTHADIEVTDINSVRAVLTKVKPDVVINTAAYVRVDDCEVYPKRTFSVNAIGAKNVAITTQDVGAILVHISTDYVFNGEKGEPYHEEDCPHPINTYGISKLAGEYYVELLKKYYIIRISSLFGAAGARGKGGNFVETIIQKTRNQEPITVVDDMVISPTYTKDAAKIVREITKRNLPYGIYHAANSGYCSWYDFAQSIFGLLNLDVELKRIQTNNLILRARRPMFSALDITKLSKLGLKMRSWQDALKEYLQEKRLYALSNSE